MAFTDSEPGFLDLEAAYGVRLVAGSPGGLDLEPNFLQPALFWKVVAGQRIPLFSRGGISTAQRRRSLVPGNFFPDASTTGVYDDSLLVDMTGSTPLIITTPETHYENVRFLRNVEVRTAGVSFRNCEFRGPGVAMGTLLLTAVHQDVETLLIEDCTFAPAYASDNQNNIMGHGMKVLRCEMRGGVDNIGAAPYTSGPNSGRVNTEIMGCWMHSTWFFSPHPGQSDNVTHTDVIQWHGGGGLTIYGNRLEGYLNPAIGQASDPPLPVGGYPTNHASGNPWGASSLTGKLYGMSILMISPGNGTHSELVFEKNWMTGSLVGINGIGARLDFLEPGNASVKGNRISVDWKNTMDSIAGFTVPTSFAMVFQSDHFIDVQDNWLWDTLDDPFAHEGITPNNTRRNI